MAVQTRAAVVAIMAAVIVAEAPQAIKRTRQLVHHVPRSPPPLDQTANDAVEGKAIVGEVRLLGPRAIASTVELAFSATATRPI